MHVLGLIGSLDLNSFLFNFIVTTLIFVLGFLYLVIKNTASNYFVLDANFDTTNNKEESSSTTTKKKMEMGNNKGCVICTNPTTKQCSACKLVKYCSTACQRSHWNSGHKKECSNILVSGKENSMQSGSVLQGRKLFSAVPQNSGSGSSKRVDESEILFPYDKFVQLFNWEKPGFPPCGLFNCGNSCFANVVLQCLGCTRPLVAYFLEKGHQSECRRNDWCFMCEFQKHLERSIRTTQPFSPINILSRLPNICVNFGYGKQEDAHEFMRFAIDTMQSVCLDEFGGEKSVHPRAQETTFIQHIFGGQLQSQVICTKCNNVSNQFENMMDLTVEIQGDATSLEECLDQFTIRERLHGDNMYKCDGCNDYVLAWKCLTIRRPPNILTIALKRFQSGRFGKLNKRVSFPETLDLSPYMSEVGNEEHIYKLYAVVVHVDMLNASYFGHYICYTKDFSGNWYRIDDCKVCRVDLEEVLSQGAYMLMYSRVNVRPSCSNPMELAKKNEEKLEVAQMMLPCVTQTVENSAAESITINAASGTLPSNTISEAISVSEEEVSSVTSVKDPSVVNMEVSSSVSDDVEILESEQSNAAEASVSAIDNPHNPVSEDSTALPMPEPCVMELEPLNPVSNVESMNGDDVSSVIGCVVRDSVVISSTEPSRDGVREKNNALHEDSITVLSTSEGLEGACPDSSGEANIMESVNGLPYSVSIGDSAGKKNGIDISGSKSKPLFTPGFLGKRPRKKTLDQQAEAVAEIDELVSACKLNCQSNGFAKHDLPHPVEGETSKQEPKFPSDVLGKQTGNTKAQLVESRSSDSVILCNGSDYTCSGSCESFDIVDDMSVTDDLIPIQDGSVATVSASEVLDGAHPITSNVKQAKVEHGKGSPSSRDKNNIEGKLKPLFSPGFLGKRPRGKYSKQDAKALEGTNGLTTAC